MFVKVKMDGKEQLVNLAAVQIIRKRGDLFYEVIMINGEIHKVEHREIVKIFEVIKQTL
jgi:hypothetical protein